MEELTQERIGYLKADYVQGFIEHCGFQVLSVEKGRFVSTIEIGPEHRQQDDFIHAGVMATMADHTAGYSAFTIVPEDYQILTIEFKVNFLKPAYGDSLICHSRVIREGNQIIISESEVFDSRKGEKTLVAKAIVTLMAVQKDRLSL